ncbi:histidine phosphatase family protein [Pseudacidovorax intermedius]|uniref:Putative phosphoglycerate mutase n=1 Tax=Pseudacidovorax intermedius TaxID=433924 RepID=A0A370F9C3_9BURK|nr:histidine phosphatase family protein [Pseudacidovorax intermedius]RDI19029.1 putative phosphoglycerate mutase [Pseudacidovorax intermedius]
MTHPAPQLTQHAKGLAQLIQLASATPLDPAVDHFYFLRHGQTPRNALRIFQSYDEPLSDLGLQQAALAAAVLANEPIRSIVCSDARRAFDTAHTVAAPLKLTPVAREVLRERHFGCLVGTSSVDIDWACAPEGGETLAQFVDRKRAALDAALQEPAPVLVVAHGGTLYVLAALLNVTVDAAVLGNAQPLRFDRAADGRWGVRALRAADGSIAAVA